MKGRLYEHAARPEWGMGMLVEYKDALPVMRWTDGEVRTVYRPEQLREVDLDHKAEPPKRTDRDTKPAKVQRRARAGSPTRTAGRCSQCGVACESGWACKPCRARKSQLQKERRAKLARKPRSLGCCKGPLWTPEETAWLVELLATTSSDRELALHFPTRPRSGVRAKRLELGHPRQGVRESWTPEEIAKHDAWKAAGRRDADLAAEMGRSVGAIRLFRMRRRKAASAT